jgi:hypothetical protein
MANPKMYRPEWISDRLRQPWQAEAEKYEATAKAAAGTRCVDGRHLAAYGSDQRLVTCLLQKDHSRTDPIGLELDSVERRNGAR